MYVVLIAGGKQYKVEQGSLLRIERIKGDINSEIIFDNIVMFYDDNIVKIGTPRLKDVVVNAHIVNQEKMKKIIVFKYKRRKRYRRKYGHRQRYTEVIIDSIKKI